MARYVVNYRVGPQWFSWASFSTKFFAKWELRKIKRTIPGIRAEIVDTGKNHG